MGICHFPVSTRRRNVLIDLLRIRPLYRLPESAMSLYSKSSSFGRDKYGYILVS